MRNRKCRYCGKEILSPKKNVRYCNNVCRFENSKKRAEERKRAAVIEKTMSPLARTEAAAREAGMHYGLYVALKGV